MEEAIHITSVKNLKYFQKSKHQRIYWGTEFCQNLIPTMRDTEKILGIIERGDLKFTFVTPFVVEYGLKKLNEIFLWLKKRGLSCEIVVNDWGVLECLHGVFGNYFELVLGRLLVRQQRDPAIEKVVKKQLPLVFKSKEGRINVVVHKIPSQGYQEGVKASYINAQICQRFLVKYGIKRIELNNIIQGLNLEGVKFKKSLYSPFINISTTRFCPMETRFQKIYRIGVCRRECQRYYEVLRNKAVPKVIYKRGNTIFYKNPVILKEVRKLGIDRIVYQPELPY